MNYYQYNCEHAVTRWFLVTHDPPRRINNNISMPSITLHPRPHIPETPHKPTGTNPLPGLLSTPLGLAILEVQGSLNLPTKRKDVEEDSIHLGRLEFPLLSATFNGQVANHEGAWTKKVYFYVGQHQRLTGELRKLAKPLAVIRRRDGGSGVPGQGGEVDEELEIAEIIRWKIFFGGRPEFI